MTDLRPDIDLEQLARTRRGPDVPRPPIFKKIWLLPLAVLVVLVVLLSSTIGDLLREGREVTVIRPRPAQGIARQAGTVVLQAAGWVEPDPFPITVTALTGGVVEDMLVQESQPVKANEVVARLIPDTRRYELERAEAELLTARARLTSAEVESANAKESFEAALGVTESLAVTKAEYDGHVEECARAEAAAEVVAARLEVAEAELKTQRFLAREGAAGPWQVELAEAKHKELAAALKTAKLETTRSRILRDASKAKLERARRDVELRLEDRLRVERAKSMVDLERGRVSEAEAKRDFAKLELDRCAVRAPADGIVMERLAMPGSVVYEDKHGTPVCTLYDPKSLRIRVDVPQADVSLVRVEQKARVLSNSRPERPYEGRVLRIVERADIQKVTLEVQVEIVDSDELLKPEMLCQVRFLAAGEENPDVVVGSAMLVPQRLLVGDDGIWVLDASQEQARLRKVRVGARRGDDVEILDGLNASDKLIDLGREGLEDGMAVRLRGER